MRRSHRGVIALLFSFFLSGPALAVDRSITSITLTPDNTFDNALTAVGSDSGTYIQLNLSGGAAAANDPDGEAGYRLAVYNTSGDLVRRLGSLEISANPTGIVRFNGQGDSAVNDTLAYGSYTLRAYSSMRTPTIPASIRGSGTTIDRPGDMHVTDGGVLSWVNTGTRLSFCQVSLGDPNTQDATFLRLTDFPTGFGLANTDRAWGIVMNSANEVFLSDNNNGGAAGVRIAKYSTTTDTWLTLAWATAASTTLADGEWSGLGIDNKDSIYLATSTATAGGGAGGGAEFAVKFRDNGLTGTQINISADMTEDYNDVAPVPSGDTYVYTLNRRRMQIVRFTTTLATSLDPLVDFGAGTPEGGMDVIPNGSIYLTNNTVTPSEYRKYKPDGTLHYTVTDARLNNASGIAVWCKTSTNETFVMVGGRTSNVIVIYSENAAGDSATFLRQITDDEDNLSAPEGLAVDQDSAIFVVNRTSRAIKKFSTDGVFQNLSGATNGKFIVGIDVTAGLTDSNSFNVPRAIAIDTDGNIYVFDHDALTTPTQLALKKFSPVGAPLGVIADLDGLGWGGAASPLNQPVIQATFGAGSIYAATNDDAARVIRLSTTGALLGHLGTATAGGGADAAEGATASDVASLQIAPFFDRATNRFHPQALYVYMGTTDQIEVWTTDLSSRLLTAVVPQEITATNPSANNVVSFLVDDNGELYAMNDGVSGGNYIFRKWNAAAPAAAGGSVLAANSLLEASISQGTLSSQFDQPREAVWTDNRGIYKINPVTGRYERKIWINDSNNNRLQQMLLEWNDVREEPITIALSQDTPLVISASLSSDTLATVGGTYYVGASVCTMQINFNKAMVTTPTPDTLTIQIKPTGGSFTTVNQLSYTNATWTGTTVLTSGMNDGEVIIKVADAYDNTGPVQFIVPNPDQTDFDGADDFKPFIIDNTGPVISVTSPPISGDSTSQATYTVSGQVTSEATGLDATIQLINYTTLTGVGVYDVKTITASGENGSFSAILNLRAPAPTDNFIEVVAVDKLGNRTVLSPRRLVQRAKNVGNAYIEPSTETTVGDLRRYVLTYMAAQTLGADTVRFTVPAAWSTPQDGAPTTNGYVTVSTAGTYTDSSFAGQVMTINGVALTIGQTLLVTYGDTAGGATGAAGSTINASLADAANTFQAALQQAGETTFTAVTAPSGKSLTVPLRDSSVAVMVTETGPGGTSIEIAKGQDTKVIVVRFFNSNLGAHTNRVTQLTFGVESNTGAAINWNTVASRVVLKNTSEGITFADVISMPASQNLVINPASLTISQGLSRDVEFHVTIAAGASADTARFFFSAPDAFIAVDDASGKSLTMLAQGIGVTGQKTGLYDIIGLAPADTLSLGGDTSLTPAQVSTGQRDVGVMDITLRNDPPGPDTPVNTMRVDRMIFSVRDSAGAGLIPGRVLQGIHIRSQSGATTYGGLDTPSIASFGDTLQIDLSGLTIASNQTITVRVFVDIVNDTITASTFRIRLNDTGTLTVKDQTSQATVKVRDDPTRTETLPFQTRVITILRRARATLGSVTPLRLDSTIIRGELGNTLLTGEPFFIALNWQAATNKSALRVEPSDTDFLLLIGGVNRTSEFTVTAPAANNIASGSQDTFTYTVVQNLGSTAGVLTIAMADTTVDTRPRLFDTNDPSDPDKLRAELALPPPTDTVTITSAPLVVSVFTLDTSYANPRKDTVTILKFQIRNNAIAVRQVDSVVVEAISAGAAISSVNLYHDNDNGVLNVATDTLVGSGTLGAGDSVLLMLSPRPAISASGGTETFFVTFNFAAAQTDGDTVDAQIPALGVRVLLETNVPASSINSVGMGIIEVIADRITITPDTQIVALGASPSVTLKAVDRFSNLDNVINYETPSVQGHNIQVTVAIANTYDADTSHRINATAGMTGITPAPGYGVLSINGNLVGAQGVVTFTDTAAETVAISLASTLVDSTGAIEFANLISASAINLVATDSGKPDSKAVNVLAVRVTNQSGSNDQITQIGIRSLNTSDANVSAVILFKDLNGNGRIDSGTDQTIATENFSGGFATFDFLTIAVDDQDSILLLVGYDILTTVTDWNLIDARADTMTISSTGQNLAANPLNSTPDRRIDVQAVGLKLTPTTATNGTGANVTVAVAAKDTFANVDRDYTGGATKVYFDLSLSGTFNSALTTMVNKENPVGGDVTQIKGNLVQGEANLVFTDNTAETTVLDTVAVPGITGPHDTGAYVFQQGMLATPLTADQKVVEPGDTNVVLMAFRVSATGVSDSLASFKFNWQGTDSKDVKNVRLFRDMNADDTFSLAGGDTKYGNAVAFSGETVTFMAVYTNDTPYVASGTSRSFFLVADIADTAVGADTLDVRLLVGAITTQGNIPNVPLITRTSPGYDTVARVPDTFRIGRVATADRQASEDQTEIIPMTLRFSSPNIADRKFYVETFSIMVEGPTGGRAPNTVIARAQLRNQSSGIVYVNKTAIESSGDSMVFAIRFDSAAPMSIGGTTPETITVDVVLTIASTVTHNDTFRLRVNALDTAWTRVFDHPLSTVGFSRQKNNVAVLSPSSLPLLGSVVTVQKKAMVTQQAIRITDPAGADITQYTQGEQFKVEVGLRATASRADAQVQSRDTDLTFRRNNGVTDITSEFVILSRTHTTLTALAAGAQDTVIYTVTHGAPFSGAGETLVINNFLSTDTGPFTIDANSAADAAKLRVYSAENTNSTDAVRIDSAYVNVTVLSLPALDIAPDSQGSRILGVRLTDGGQRDTITGVRIHLLTPAAAPMIKSAWIAMDTNKNGIYDTATDPYFGAVQDFKTSDTVYFTGSYQLYGSADTRELYMLINLETSPVTDSTQIKVEIVIDGLGFQGQDSIPKTVQSNSALFRTLIVATRLRVTPDSQTVSAGAGAALTIQALDSYGNVNTRTTNYAAVTVNALIKDTWTPAVDKSARWTSTTLTSQNPAALPSAMYYDTLVSGKLTTGAGTVNMTDTQAETVAVVFSATGLAGDTVRVAFSADPSVAAVALTALGKISPDSTNAVILQFDVAYPFTTTTVDSIYVVSENTFDTAIKRLRLWTDSDGNGLFSSTTDSNVDTAVWASGVAAFLTGGKSFVKPAATSAIRFFVTVEMETSPQNDNDSIGARINPLGVRLTPGGSFPPTGELDSISNDTQNAVIDIDAMLTGGVVRFVNPGQQNKDLPFTLTVRAEDKYGNLDRVFTTLGTSGARNITFSAAPAGFTFNSTSMTTVSGWPGAAPVARFRLGADTILITPTVADTIVLTADVNTPPPADTTIQIVVVAGGWSVAAQALTDSEFVGGDTGVVLSSVVFKNLDVLTDTLVRIDFTDIGNVVANTNIAGVQLWRDTNANTTFDTGVDQLLGGTTFSAAETAAFNVTRAMAFLGRETYFLVASIVASPTAAAGETINISFVALSCSTTRFGSIPTSNVTHADSLALRPAGDLLADSLAMPSGNFPSGATNVMIGNFTVRNTRTFQDTITSITLWNDTGAHMDTGITNVRIFIDANKSGAYEVATDVTQFGGTPDSFFQRKLIKTGTRNIPASDTVGLLVVANLSPTLTLDNQFLRARIDTGGIASIFPDSAGTIVLKSTGSVRTLVNVAASDSVQVRGGSAPVTETVTVSVSVLDTNGVPAQRRYVRLFVSPPAAITFLSANNATTDTQGIVLFSITTATAGVYTCTTSIETAVFPTSIGYANFLSTLAMSDRAFTNNSAHSTNTGATRKYSSPLSYSPTTAGLAAELRYNNLDYSVYDYTAGVPRLLWNVNNFLSCTIANPAPDYTSWARVRTIAGVGNDNVVFGGFSSSGNFGSNLYYKPLGQAAGTAPVRISVNDKRCTYPLAFDTDAQFGQFDVNPAGNEVVFAFDGNLARFSAVGATFNPAADSGTLEFYTRLRGPDSLVIGGYQQPGPHIQYPTWSPDGTRIAFTVVYRDTGWNPAASPGSDSAEIWVLKNVAGVQRGGFPFDTAAPSIDTLPLSGSSAFLKRITHTSALRFAWQPQWSTDGSAIFFSANNNSNFNYDKFSQLEDPQLAINGAGVDFNTYMIYYDQAAETAPYAPILLQHEIGISELAGEMSFGGESVAYLRAATTDFYEERSLRVSNVANITANGGILFDSGRIVVVVPNTDVHGTGFKISVTKPDSSPVGNDSIIISGLAKRFFNPDTPTSPVFFPESVKVILYYAASHFNDTDKTGYDSDGDGIADRTEAAVGAYYWTGTVWQAYPTVRYPSENKIEFFTNHFSTYGVGMPMDARALALGGNVQDVVVYPNPWRSDGPTGSLSPSDERYGIKLTKMPGPDVRVRIFTIAGEILLNATVNAANGTSTNPSLRVTQAIINDGNALGTVSWNLGNQSGRHIASGTYLIILEGPGGRAVKKVAVIR